LGGTNYTIHKLPLRAYLQFNDAAEFQRSMASYLLLSPSLTQGKDLEDGAAKGISTAAKV
jgi:hypothetical protein